MPPLTWVVSSLQMWASLSKLAALPAATKIYCG